MDDPTTKAGTRIGRWVEVLAAAGCGVSSRPSRRAAEGLDAYLAAAVLEAVRETLFQSVDRPRERLTGRALTPRVVLAMIKRRAAATRLPPSTCCHALRAPRITADLSNGERSRTRRRLPDTPRSDVTPWALAQQEPRGDDQDRGHRDLRNFGRDPALVGRTVRLAPFLGLTVVGVAANP